MENTSYAKEQNYRTAPTAHTKAAAAFFSGYTHTAHTRRNEVRERVREKMNHKREMNTPTVVHNTTAVNERCCCCSHTQKHGVQR